MIDITNQSRKIIDINTGNEYGDFGYAPPISSMVNCIGEKKRLEFVYTMDYMDPLDGKNIFINIALFMAKGAIIPFKGKGSVYWECSLPSSAVPGVYDCNLNSGLSIFNLDVFRNYKVSIEIFDSTTFMVIAEWYQTYDVLGYMNATMVLENSTRFLKDKYNNLVNNNVSGLSIYNGGKSDGRVYIYIEDPNDDSINGYVETLFGDYTANFSGVMLSDIVFKNMAYEAQCSVPQAVQGPKTTVNTTVTITFECPHFVPTVYVMAFKTNQYSNVLSFIDNYQAETAFIDPSQANQNLIIAPFQAPFDPVGYGMEYAASFTLNAAALNVGDQIGYIFMIYNPTGNQVVGIYQQTGTGGGGGQGANNNIPYNGNGFTPTGELWDIDRAFTGNNLQCVIEERMSSKLKLDFPFNQYRNDILARLGIDIGTNNILAYLQSIDFIIYEEYASPLYPFNPANTIANYFVERKLIAQPGNPIPFSGLGANLQTWFGAGCEVTLGVDTMTLQAYWRNRYEQNLLCNRSTLAGVDYGQQYSSQDWSGKLLQVDWRLNFVYNNIPFPFTDIVIFKQFLQVKGYAVDGSIEIHTQNPDQDASPYFCLDEFLDLKSVFNPGMAQYDLITTIEHMPGAIIIIKEAEAWVPRKLPQQITSKILLEESTYGQTLANSAKFRVNPSFFIAGDDYKISAMAKKYVP